MYLLAILFPPLAVLLCRKPGQAFLNFVLWCIFIIPGIIHGFMVVNEYKANQRMIKQAELLRNRV